MPEVVRLLHCFCQIGEQCFLSLRFDVALDLEEKREKGFKCLQLHTDDRGILNLGMLEQQTLELGGSHLVTFDFDEFLSFVSTRESAGAGVVWQGGLVGSATFFLSTM